MEKCNKCGNKLSPLDVLCPRCCALVEKVQAFSAVSEELRALTGAKNDPPPSDTENVQDGHTSQPPPDTNPTIPSDAPENSHSDSQAVSDSYTAGSNPVTIEPNDSEIPPAINETLSSITSAEDTPPSVQDEAADEPVTDELSKLNQETEHKNWLEIIELSQPAYRKGYAQPADSEEKRYRSKSKTASEKRPVFLTFFIWLLTAGVLFGVFHFLGRYIISTYGSYGAFVHQLTAGKIELDSDAAFADSIMININEAKNELGEPAHRFDVSAFKGTEVRLLPFNKTFPMDNGHSVFVVSDKDLARALGIVTSSDTYESDNINLVINTGRQEVTRSAGNIMLKMTPVPYSRTVPMLEQSSVSGETANISIAVNKEAKVYINQNDYSSQIDENGQLSIMLPLEPGENYIKVDVCQIGFKTIQDSFVILREEG